MKNRHRLMIVLLLSGIFLMLFPIHACAQEKTPEEEIEAAMQSSAEELNAETQTLLEELGIWPFSAEAVLHLSFRTVVRTLLELLSGGLRDAGWLFIRLSILILICAQCASFCANGSKRESIWSFGVILLLFLCTAKPMLTCFGAALSSVRVFSNFLLTYIPGFAGVVAFSGKPLTSAAYSASMLALSNAYAQFGNLYFSPFLLAFLYLSLFSTLQTPIRLEPFLQAVKSILCTGFALCGTLFTGALAIKGTLAAHTDSLSLRGAKMLIGTAVPIVGGTLKEGMSSVLASTALIKSTFGMFGILAVTAIFVPSLIQLTAYLLIFKFLSALAAACSQERIQIFVTRLVDVLSILEAYLLFSCFIFIICTGLVLQFKGG